MSIEKTIEIKDLSVYYGSSRALSNLTLDFHRGEFTVVLGPNGSGKSTLLKTICGLCRYQTGSIRVLGEVPSPFNYRLRKRIAYMSQVEQIDPKMPITVRESVAIGRKGTKRLGQHLTSADWDKVEQILESVGILHLADKPLGQLSGGERQKTALARALAQEAPIFLLDEPTASIDPTAQVELLELIQNNNVLHQQTTLYVTHEIAMIPQRSDRILMLKQGNMWADGKPESLLNEEILTELYGGQPLCCRRIIPHTH